MYCLKCGQATGRDSELCDNCADDPITDQSVKAIAEAQEADAEKTLVRCPACNQRVLADLPNCPSCGAHIPTTA